MKNSMQRQYDGVRKMFSRKPKQHRVELLYEKRLIDMHLYRRQLPKNSSYSPETVLDNLIRATGRPPERIMGYMRYIGTINIQDNGAPSTSDESIKKSLEERLPKILGVRLRQGDSLSYVIDDIDSDKSFSGTITNE